MKRKGRLKKDSESRDRDQKASNEIKDSLNFSKDTREELDFQFDEELEVLPKTGRQHDFSEW